MVYKSSIVICSFNRPESLQRLLQSLEIQTRKDFNIIICKEEGHLVELKDRFWREAPGEIIIWLDDDVVCEPDWFKNMMQWFDKTHIVGVTGPTWIPSEYLKNRDIFKEGLFKKLYCWFFLNNKAGMPGMITKCGANTIGGSFPSPYTQQVQEVDFMEPSQFAVRKWVMKAVDGFDLGFKGVAEWSDVDLTYKIKKYGSVYFCPDVKVIHFPEKEKDDVYDKRLDTASRYSNYCRWADRWIKPTLKHRIYRLFLKTYFYMKGKRWI